MCPFRHAGMLRSWLFLLLCSAAALYFEYVECHVIGYDCRNNEQCVTLSQCLSQSDSNGPIKFEGCQGPTPQHHVCCSVSSASIPSHHGGSNLWFPPPVVTTQVPPFPQRPDYQTSEIMQLLHQLMQQNRPTAKPVHSNRPAPVPLAPPTAAISPNSLKCGKPGPSFFIVGGEETDVGEFPWMAILQYRMVNRDTRRTVGQRWLCGGSLIHEKFVLTAAHCLTLDADQPGGKIIYEPVMVRLGEHQFLSNPDCFTPADRHTRVCTATQDFRILRSNVIIHPDFDKRSRSSDDIALIRLPRSAEITNNVQPICLPPRRLAVSSLLGRGRTPYVAGWGIHDVSQGKASDVLLKTSIAPFDKDGCIKYYKRQNIDVVDGQICFGGSGGKDSCNGDSGGPLFISTKSEFPEFTQIGIVSQGPQVCGLTGAPGVYTDVAYYIDWINDSMYNKVSSNNVPDTVRRHGTISVNPF